VVGRLGSKSVLLLSAGVVLVAGVANLVGAASGVVPPALTLPAGVTTAAGYPPIPRSIAGARGCLGLAGTGMSMDREQQVMASVTTLAGHGDRIQQIGPCPGGPVIVGLAPGQEHLAHLIWARFGRDVSLVVGLTAYHGSAGRSPRCGTVHRSSPLPAGLRLALRLKTSTVRSGAMLGVNVIVTYDGPARFFMDTGQPLEAVVVRRGTRRVVGVYSGGIGGTGYGPRLAPGQSGKIPVIGGTARCDGGIGSALPPGRYQVIVQVAPETVPHSPAYLSPPVALRVHRS
jgi:hypothetical protein